MIKRAGRLGEHHLSIVDAHTSSAVIVPGAGRPSPPEDLPEVEAALWNNYVRSMPDHWFTPETQPLLRLLCIHAATSQRLHAAIAEAADPSSRLLKCLGDETRLVLTLSDKLRLTHKSRWSGAQAEAIKHVASKVRPWEDSA